MNERYKFLKIAKRTKEEKQQAFKAKRNQVAKMLRTAEKKYWEENLQEARYKGTKSFWKVVKELNGKSKSS